MCIRDSVGIALAGRAEHRKQLRDERLAQREQRRTQYGREQQRRAQRPLRALALSLAQHEAVAGDAAVADQQRQRQRERHKRKADVGGGVSNVAHALPDEYLIDDVVEGIDQH